MVRLALATAVASVGLATSALGHHAAQAQFEVTKVVTIRGTLAKVEWINPHSWFTLHVPGANGAVEEWRLETPGPRALRLAGFTSKAALPLGATYTATLNPARNAKTIGFLNTLTLPDGKTINIKLLDPGAG